MSASEDQRPLYTPQAGTRLPFTNGRVLLLSDLMPHNGNGVARPVLRATENPDADRYPSPAMLVALNRMRFWQIIGQCILGIGAVAVVIYLVLAQ